LPDSQPCFIIAGGGGHRQDGYTAPGILHHAVSLLKRMIAELPIVVLISGTVLVGLWVSNIAYDGGMPHHVSRKLGHGAGGVAFLISYSLSSAWWPIILSAGFTALLLTAHLARPNAIRGVGGSGRNKRIMAEVWFPLVAVPAFAVSWLWLDQPAVAVASLLFMAWGDGVTGLVRSQVYHRPVKGLWGSLAMLIVCLVISWIFIKPFWIGAAASVAAVITEWAFGDYGFFKWADDNWAVPLVSLGAILGLMALTGNL
jgi:phytol kinase